MLLASGVKAHSRNGYYEHENGNFNHGLTSMRAARGVRGRGLLAINGVKHAARGQRKHKNSCHSHNAHD